MADDRKVELIGYWAGDEGELPWTEIEIKPGTLVEKQFVFFEGAKYKIEV